MFFVYLKVYFTATCSAACTGGLAEDTGKLTWVWGSDPEDNLTATGQIQQGKRQGSWVIGFVEEGSYVDGERQDQWGLRETGGTVWEGFFVDVRLQ